MTPDPALDGIPWDKRPLLEIRRGRAEDGDPGRRHRLFRRHRRDRHADADLRPGSPTRNNFLPDTHVVVMRGDAGGRELRGWLGPAARREGEKGMPRTVNFITGPSRTGDIEQRIELGAHGPRRLHIVLVDDEAQA